MTTNQPYTEDDLRAEAARQHATLTEDPEFMCVGEAMQDAEVESHLPPAEADGAEGIHWGELLPYEADGGEAFNTAQRKIDDLIRGAADISDWAVNLGADGLEPYDGSLTLKAGEDKPIVRVFVAFDPDMPDEARDGFVEGLGHEIARYL